MKFAVYGENVTITDRMREQIENRLTELNKYIVIDISDLKPLLTACYHVFGQGVGDQLTEEKETGASFRGLKSGFAWGEAYKIIKFPNQGEDFLLRQLLPDRFRWFGNEYYPAYGELYF